MKPASRRKRVDARIGTKCCEIHLCPVEGPYLWIGHEGTCFGVVRDNQVEKLRDMCNEILARRKLESACQKAEGANA